VCPQQISLIYLDFKGEYMWFWKQKIRLVFSITLLIGCLFMNASLTAVEPDYSKIIQAIAQDIAGLKTEFKQLKMFSPATCADLERLTISYGYSTRGMESGCSKSE
jgi:hypothetical protein